eukprot:Skav216495  [mRNA]  locus=scaffold1123:544125:544510:- [translate_table: standard]
MLSLAVSWRRFEGVTMRRGFTEAKARQSQAPCPHTPASPRETPRSGPIEARMGKPWWGPLLGAAPGGLDEW